MKNRIRTRLSHILAFVTVFLLPVTMSAQYYDDNYDNQGYYDDRYDNGDYTDFYNQLSPYGNWMQDPQYGYVWKPNVGNDFRPYYSNGRWAMTDLGNMWVSNYTWGSIPFHYGRWVFSNFYGWLWIPGRQWAPAWVVWRQGGGYYGWAPMGPSININFNFGNYYNNHFDYWTFIPCGNIYYGNYHSYRYHGFNNAWFGRTIVINNYHSYRNNRFFAGPRRDDVRRYVGRNVPVYRINHTNTRGRNSIDRNSIRTYSPEIRENRNSRNTAPRNYTKIDNDRRIEYEYGRNGNRGTGNRTETTAPRNNRNSTIDRNTNRNSTTIDRNTNRNNRNSTIERNNGRNVERNNNRIERNNNSTSPQNNRNIERRNENRNVQPDRNSTPPGRNNVQPERSQPNRSQPSRSNVQPNNNRSEPSRTNVQPSRNTDVNRNTNVNRNTSAPSRNSNVNRSNSSNVRETRSVQPSRNSTPSNNSRSGSTGRGSR